MTPEEIWRGRRDSELLDAAARLDEYYEDGQQVILLELVRRGLHVSDVHPLPAPVPAPVESEPAPPEVAVVPTGSVLLRLWRGDLSLAVTYWGWVQCGGLFWAALLTGLPRVTSNQAVMLVVGIVSLAYSIVAMVGLWRSATRYKGNRVWGTLARASILLSLIAPLLERFAAR